MYGLFDASVITLEYSQAMMWLHFAEGTPSYEKESNPMLDVTIIPSFFFL